MIEQFELARHLRFESAHFLPNAPDDHKCRRLHGHSFVAEIWITGDLGDSTGWIVDFAELDRYLNPIRQQLDHRLLNDVPGLANPTSEEIARWIWHRCRQELPPNVKPRKIVVRETCESIVSYRADAPESLQSQ